jgi:hypothetical protein
VLHDLAKVGALSLFIVSSADAAVPARFDVECKGKTTINTAKGIRPGPKWYDRMRFDLATQRWCGGSCVKADGVVKRTNGDLRFTLSSKAMGANQYAARIEGTLNGTTLAVEISAKFEVYGVRRDVTRRGQCSLRPYTLIPV